MTALTRCGEREILRCGEMVTGSDHFENYSDFLGFLALIEFFVGLNHLFGFCFREFDRGKGRKGKKKSPTQINFGNKKNLKLILETQKRKFITKLMKLSL